jgi:diguanylate cyclase (GGDEF)-like protein
MAVKKPPMLRTRAAVSAVPALAGQRMEQHMDGSSARAVGTEMLGEIAPDPRDERIRELRRELDVLRRENRILKISVGELERVAERDTLTPLYNRRFFITALHQRIARVARDNVCATLVYVDVNQLKAINDEYGHAAGDFALIEIAQRLASAIRGGDIAARIGGDEFGLILDHMTAEDAKGQAARFGRLLSDVPTVFEGRTIPISACFGIATLEADMSETDVLAAADRDMYRAKMAERKAA